MSPTNHERAIEFLVKFWKHKLATSLIETDFEPTRFEICREHHVESFLLPSSRLQLIAIFTIAQCGKQP